ncbi:DUF2840 domain-containing protein [Agrobacterium tumefaciens]|uniref:DUF2840 domain-containing protein n=1 Tax=Agrobacterium tumefaciens TaxID=358 RepID=UPI0012B8FFF4|nr:DUF2840 domain-containing protein [Agrobacterium tumefaciens]MQB07990.1 DUF2840 domain-containing protein [Agrobacterium tumefaciens]
MSGRSSRNAHGRLLPGGPAPFTTLVELTFEKRKIEHWIRFGRKAYEQILDRRRSIVGFAPNSVFAFVRWAAGEHGTIISRIDIVRAIGRGEPFQTLPFVRPGGDILLRLDTWSKVEKALQAIDAVEALGLDGEKISGKFTGTVQLSSGKFAVVEQSHEFTLVPWRPVIDRHLGKEVAGIVQGGSVSWQLGRQRGLAL